MREPDKAQRSELCRAGRGKFFRLIKKGNTTPTQENFSREPDKAKRSELCRAGREKFF